MKSKTSIKILFGIIVVLSALSSNGQYKMNFGLQQPQDPATLPVTKAKPQLPVRKAKKAIKPELQQVADNQFILASGWEMAEADKVTATGKSIFNTDLNTTNWYNAIVPGTVLTTLVDQGIYPDPYYGLNNLLIPDSLCRKDWWYRLELPLPENVSGKTIWLLFNGINYKADIWLNGQKLGSIAGAFIRGHFDATPLINLKEKNILAVHIYPPHNPGIPHEESSKTNHGLNGGQLCLDGPTFISSEGWDWIPGIRDRNIGIWQDVRLILRSKVSLGDPQVITKLLLPDTTRSLVTLRQPVVNHSDKEQKITLEGAFESVYFSKEVKLKAGETKTISFTPAEFSQLNVISPKLWWPNGYGKQNLYTMTIKAIVNETVSDSKNIRFGFREYSYELAVSKETGKMWRVEFNPLLADGQILFDNINRVDIGKGVMLPKLMPDADVSMLKSIEKESNNPYLTIKVNGVPVFCKGGNWGMDDGMKRVSRERLEPYFKLHKEANYNMVRNWTGESTEEVFYDLADEYGMLVWNDFWLSTEGYNLNVNDNDLFMVNASDVVCRFRNHPSIAVWCPRNEGFATTEMEPRLQKLIATEDGTRLYSGNSRNINLRPSGPWHFLKDPAEYYISIAEGFNTELGTPSIPTAETMKSFIPEEDRWPISDTWYYHDLHDGQKEFISALETRYGKATSLDDFCRKAQFLNYDSHRAMFESWNSKMWKNASGLLLWMTHPAWPSTVWQTYSWDYETFGSYFGAQKACEPLHIQMNLHDNKVVIVNASQKNYKNLIAKLDVFDLNGKVQFTQSSTIDVNPNILTDCFTAGYNRNLTGVYLVRLTLTENKTVLSLNDYWKSGSGTFETFNTLQRVEIKAKIVKTEGEMVQIQIENVSKTPAIALKMNLKDKSNGKVVLPASFSEGYFNLLPREKKTITVKWENVGTTNADVYIEGYNVTPIPLVVIDGK